MSASMKLSRVGSSISMKACSSVAAAIQLHTQCGKAGTPSWFVYSAIASRNAAPSSLSAKVGLAADCEKATV